MQQRRRTHTFTRRQIVAAGGTLLIPAAILAWWRPWRSRTTPIITPTPILPTATRAPERIALPTERPTRPVATPATPIPATPTGPRAAGTVLSIGFIGGSGGIVSSDAEGGGHHLLVPGAYEALAWSPDGTRFAATGPIPGGGGYQVAIFAADGRPLARFPFRGNLLGSLSWSPSGRFLLTAAYAGVPQPEAWILSDEGMRRLDPPTTATGLTLGWTPNEQISYQAAVPGPTGGSTALWTADSAGQDWRLIHEGHFFPLGWDASGTRLTFLSSAIGSQPEEGPTTLSTLSVIGNVGITLADAPRLAAEVLLESGEGFYFAAGSGSPDGGQYAVVLARRSGNRTPSTAMLALVFLDAIGRVNGVVRLQDAGGVWMTGWSPDGTRLAHIFGGAEVRVYDIAAAEVATYALAQQAGITTTLAWSPDSRWLAYNEASGITVAVATGPAYSYRLTPNGIAPAWRPAI